MMNEEYYELKLKAFTLRNILNVNKKSSQKMDQQIEDDLNTVKTIIATGSYIADKETLHQVYARWSVYFKMKNITEYYT